MLAAFVFCIVAVRQGAPSPIYFVRSDSIYKAVQGHESLVIKHGAGPSPSPDQKYLAFVREGNLFVLDLQSRELKKCSNLPDFPVDASDHDLYPSWDDRSRYVVFSHADRYSVTRKGEEVHAMFGGDRSARTIWNVYWYWLKKGATRPGLSMFLGNETSGPSGFSVVSSLAASFAPDGKRVAFCRNGDLWMATVERASIQNEIHEASWDEARILPATVQEGGTRSSNETSAIFRISWSPDGKLLAISSDRYSSPGSDEITIAPADRPSEKQGSFPGSDACFVDVAHILYVKSHGHSSDIWLRDIGTGEERILIAHATDPAVVGKG